jgi:hypothetical protein
MNFLQLPQISFFNTLNAFQSINSIINLKKNNPDILKNEFFKPELTSNSFSLSSVLLETCLPFIKDCPDFPINYFFQHLTRKKSFHSNFF